MRKNILIVALIGTVVLLGVNSLNLVSENENLQNEKSQTELEYSFAMDMLDGFMLDRDGTREQVKKIPQNAVDSV